MPPSPLKQLKDIPTIAHLYRTKALLAATGIDIPANQEHNNKICTLQYDLTKLQVDAIVNAANRRLLGGGGVDGAIHMAAGPGLLDECRKLHGCETGSAKITNAYKLPCKKVIHAVGPIYETEQESEPLLRGCYRTALELAVENECKTIAFSAISTGIYGYPSRAAAKAALREVLTFLRRPEGKNLDKVIFCNFLDKDVDAYADAIPAIFPPTEEDLSETVSQVLESKPVLEEVQEEKLGIRSQDLPTSVQTWNVSPVTNGGQDFKEDKHSTRDASTEGRAQLENREEVSNKGKEVEKESIPKEFAKERNDSNITTFADTVSGANPLVKIVITAAEPDINRGTEHTDSDKPPDAASHHSTSDRPVEDEKTTKRTGRQNSYSRARYDQRRSHLDTGLGGSTAMNLVDNTSEEPGGTISDTNVLKTGCDHDLRVDDGSQSFNLWPKGRLRCGKCNAVVAHRFWC